VRAINSLLAGILVLAALTTAGCTSKEKAGTVSGSAPNLAESPTATTTVERQASPAAAATQDVAPGKLKGMLLTLDDLPQGWAVSPPSTPDDSDTSICNADTLPQFRGGESAEADFQQSDFGPFVFQLVKALPSSSEAKQAMAAVKKTLSSCSSWTETDTDGTKSTWTIAPLSMPAVGDETFTARISTSDVPLFGTVQADFVFFRRGSVVEVVAYFGFGPSADGPSPLESVAKKAAERAR
jgi:outer membrane murein-binding lipoprotein Lpp